MAKIYTVFNNETKEEITVTAEQLDRMFPELKAGKLEIVDEIEENYSIAKDNIYPWLATILETVQDIDDPIICNRLVNSVKQIELALKEVHSV